jgi:hypothetical protein
MNDTELDELLNAWSPPQLPAALRERVRAGFAAELEPSTIPGAPLGRVTVFVRRSLLAGALLATGAFLLFVVTEAFPQTLGLSPPVKIPYTVESEIVQYSADGTPRVVMYWTSYNENGRMIILSRSFPGNPLENVIQQILSIWRQFMERHARNIERKEPSAQARAAATARAEALIRAGCVQGVFLGRETILNYPTVASQVYLPGGRRETMWLAPDLGCAGLRSEQEEQRPDGTFRLFLRIQAIKVTVNP